MLNWNISVKAANTELFYRKGRITIPSTSNVGDNRY